MNNIFLQKLQKDLEQNRYNLEKVGLFNGSLKIALMNLLKVLDDFELKKESKKKGD